MVVTEKEKSCELSEKKKYTVHLRKYDVSHKMNKEILSKMVGFKVDGIWHTSIEIHETEYFMGNGIEMAVPGTVDRYGILVERTLIGETECSPETLQEFIDDHKDTMWAPETYHLLDHNCNHFTDYLSNFLVQKGIPSDILELSEKVKANPAISQIYTQNMKGFHKFINETRK
ncbi:desi1 [Ecytonucleospora hepatopenaei]|uniref:Desi1 n=1 Tax=Ecytonucleospora hepatopenaei TaxID=646526 RepID=A0A1W0E8T1_9MICR|nr:desi1 [Ecytonucleospora hepatopenaei]